MTTVQAPSTFEHGLVVSRYTGTDAPPSSDCAGLILRIPGCWGQSTARKCELHCPAGSTGWIAERDELIKESK
jgi:hypothetical protein